MDWKMRNLHFESVKETTPKYKAFPINTLDSIHDFACEDVEQKLVNACRNLSMKKISLLKILSFVTSHYVIGMQLVIVCNCLGHVCNYKFGIV